MRVTTRFEIKVELKELVPVDVHEPKYNFVAHSDVKPKSAMQTLYKCNSFKRSSYE